MITFFKVSYVCNFKERLGNYGAEATQRAVFDMSYEYYEGSREKYIIGAVQKSALLESSRDFG